VVAATLLQRAELGGETERAVQRLLTTAFPDFTGVYYARQEPERIVLLWDGDVLIGHATAYVRTVQLGDEDVTIGLVGDVAVDPRLQRRGHARRLVREAHALFAERSLPFSVLFAFDPARYRSSGYQDMTNETRFLDGDGHWRQLVFRGGMVAELGARRWPGGTLDLRGPAV
jgi:predicted N-acetyltransferase YhbS